MVVRRWCRGWKSLDNSLNYQLAAHPQRFLSDLFCFAIFRWGFFRFPSLLFDISPLDRDCFSVTTALGATTYRPAHSNLTYLLRISGFGW
jgi:hypothetical protein